MNNSIWKFDQVLPGILNDLNGKTWSNFQFRKIQKIKFLPIKKEYSWISKRNEILDVSKDLTELMCSRINNSVLDVQNNTENCKEIHNDTVIYKRYFGRKKKSECRICPAGHYCEAVELDKKVCSPGRSRQKASRSSKEFFS